MAAWFERPWYERLLAPVLALGAAVILTCCALGALIGGMPPGELLLAALMVIGLPEVAREDRHFRVRLLESVLPAWLRRLQHRFACVIGALLAAALAWRLMERAGAMLDADASVVFDPRIPMLVGWLAVLMLLAAIALAILACARR